MSIAASPEQEELRQVLRRFFAAKSDEAAVRRCMADPRGYDPGVWRQLCEQLGVPALAVPEAYGGAGFGLGEVGVAFEEAGRSLACVPMLSTFLATQALLLTGDESARVDLLPGIAAGETLATLAWISDDGRGRAEIAADAGRLSGTASFVLDGHVADVLLVLAGGTLYRIDAAGSGVRVEPLETLDMTRRQARITLDGVPAERLGSAGDGDRILAGVLDRVVVMLAAEQVGGAGRALEMAVEYAKVRHQFGRPIGSFQAVKHKCADMYVQLETARSAAGYAVWAAQHAPGELPMAAAIAAAWCSEAYTFVAAENIQVHGGIGFTWEHPAHLYFKRAKSSELLFGTPTEHRDRIADLVGM